jgi:hypothetical protein
MSLLQHQGRELQILALAGCMLAMCYGLTMLLDTWYNDGSGGLENSPAAKAVAWILFLLNLHVWLAAVATLSVLLLLLGGTA